MGGKKDSCQVQRRDEYSFIGRKKKTIFLIVLLLFFSCGNEKTGISGFITTDGRWFVDEYGRKVIFRGINVSDRSKKPPFFPEMSYDEIERLKSWGFNSVRFLIIWEAIEPQKGKIDYNYIKKVREWVEEFKKQGIFVILDMHQDIFSRKLGGDGAPYWAVKDYEYEYLSPWYINYLQPAVILNFDRFWRNEDELQEHYISAWLEIVKEFKEEPYVIGYEIMNEPYQGSIPFVNGEFEREYLQPFYERVIREIRKIDKNHIIFFEPCIVKGGGLKSYLGKMLFDNIAYAPHYYDPFVLWVLPYDGDERRTESAFYINEEEAKRMGVPWVLGEFGILFGTENWDEYLEDHMKLIEKFMVSSFYWNYNVAEDDYMSPVKPDGSERCEEVCMMDVLSRPYPSFINGTPLELSYERENGRFYFRFISANKIMPTEIVIPKRLFKIKISINIKGGDYAISPQRGMLEVYAERNKEVEVILFFRNS